MAFLKGAPASARTSVLGGHRSVFGAEGEIDRVDLNLTPLMDVMSNILFFLMASVGASVVALLPASVPTRSEQASAAEPPVDQVLVTLQVTPAGFKATAANERLTPAETAPLRFELAKLPGKDEKGGWAMPYEELTRRLATIKDKYRASDTVIILPEGEVPYDVIIKTMDAARGLGKEAHRTLFPKVVISDLVK